MVSSRLPEVVYSLS